MIYFVKQMGLVVAVGSESVFKWADYNFILKIWALVTNLEGGLRVRGKDLLKEVKVIGKFIGLLFFGVAVGFVRFGFVAIGFSLKDLQWWFSFI